MFFENKNSVKLIMWFSFDCEKQIFEIASNFSAVLIKICATLTTTATMESSSSGRFQMAFVMFLMLFSASLAIEQKEVSFIIFS